MQVSDDHSIVYVFSDQSPLRYRRAFGVTLAISPRLSGSGSALLTSIELLLFVCRLVFLVLTEPILMKTGWLCDRLWCGVGTFCGAGGNC